MPAGNGKKRLPRAERVKPSERPPMVLTDRDRDILEAVNAYQAMRGGQIEALFFTSRSTTQYRLARLFHHEFLDRHFQAVISGAPASSPMIYTLGRRGAYVLQHDLGYIPARIRRFARSPAWLFMEHLLDLNDFRIAVTLACRAHGFTLEEWLDEPVFRAKPDYVTVRDSRGRERQKPVYPDGYFSLSVPRGRTRFFVELDRGVETHGKFRPQIEVYEAYTRSGLYQQRFSEKSLRILVVTTTAQRLANLKTTTRRAGGDRKYWLTTLAQVAPETVLTAPIWQTLKSDQPRSLIE